MSIQVAIPSRGRLREPVLDLLAQVGLSGREASQAIGIEFIEMRPRDAGAWLEAGRLAGSFLSTDIVLEEDLASLPAVGLGLATSTLVAAVRESDSRSEGRDLAGATIATHLPSATGRWLGGLGIEAKIVTMGGALEGICASGMADAIVDLRESGASLAQHRLRVVAEIAACQALFVYSDTAGLDELVTRLRAALEGREQRYVMFHLAPDRLDDLVGLFHGLASPTVLPRAGRADPVAVHLVLAAGDFWSGLSRLRALGASGIVALRPDALLP